MSPPHGEWESYELINHYFQYTDEDEIDDMAFNYADKKLYALDKSNRLYPSTCIPVRWSKLPV